MPRKESHEAMQAWFEADPVARWLTRLILRLVETLFLMSYGWRRTNNPTHAEDAWEPPQAHPKSPSLYGRTHAVNSTHYYITQMDRDQRWRKRTRSR